VRAVVRDASGVDTGLTRYVGDFGCGEPNRFSDRRSVARTPPSPVNFDRDDALIKAVRKLLTALRKLLTWDRSSKLSDHNKFTVVTDVQVYFCDPSSPWRRGSNENTNGLLRQ
jgi:IS30 family transposase